jgi:erythromycin esterase-like protein
MDHKTTLKGRDSNILDILKQTSSKLENTSDLDPLIERIGDARYVLLGEASHGTSEYYSWRARITTRLIQEKGFSLIAVEGDWPDCYNVNRYIKGYVQTDAKAAAVLGSFKRWPTWMWANWEIVALSEWLRQHNLLVDKKVSFYGLDVYSLWESMNAIISYLEKTAPDAVEKALQAYRCFEPFGEDEQAYALHTLMVPENCEEEVVQLLSELRERTPHYAEDPEDAFSAEQNALIMKNAEHYYRSMVRGDETWNLRDNHMVDTLDRLMDFHGLHAKVIVWAHNTHIGDARATNMAQAGLVNIGQLVRQRHRNAGVILTGFGSFSGSVIAGKGWGNPMEKMLVPAAKYGSWEELFHRMNAGNRLLLTVGLREYADFMHQRAHRAIGVVYTPEREQFGNYVPTVLPDRYDAFLHFDETNALHPLKIKPEAELKPPETYPWGF